MTFGVSFGVRAGVGCCGFCCGLGDRRWREMVWKTG